MKKHKSFKDIFYYLRIGGGKILMEEKLKGDVGLKPSISIVGGVGWLIFVIIWFAFYATNFPW